MNITNVSIQEKQGITEIVFDMDALIYPDASLDSNNSQVIVTIPPEANWKIPENNDSMIGLFEGYKLENTDNTLVFKADVPPGIKMVDSYSVNSDPTKPQFVIELSKINASQADPVSQPEQDPTKMSTFVDEDPVEQSPSSTEQNVKKLLIGKAPNFTIFKILVGPTIQLKAQQEGSKVFINVPKTDWSKVQAGEKFLGVMRDKKSGNVITIETPIQDWDDMDDAKKPRSLIIDYYVEEIEPDNQMLVLRLEEGVHMISALHKKEGSDQYYVLKFKEKKTPQNEITPIDDTAMTQKTIAARPPTLHINEGKAPSEQPQTRFSKEPYKTAQEKSVTPKKIKHQNYMIDVLDNSKQAQTTNESGAIPDWVRDAQNKIKKK
jgi:hypothetical protein